MNLPAIDLGLMNQHLSAHEGAINRLNIYRQSVNDPVLKQIIKIHSQMLRNHVAVMLELINPNRTREVKLPGIQELQMNASTGQLAEWEKAIALDGKSTAKFMANDNFNSALMMKDMNVKTIHLQMAYQDVSVQMMYDMLINAANGGFEPMVSEEMQWRTLEKFQHVLKV